MGSVLPLRAAMSALLAAALATLLLGALAAAQEGDGPNAEGATIDKTAWWNQNNPGVDSPAGIVTIPPPPNIPEHGIAVSVTAGENDKNAGVGIRPDAEDGDTVTAFTLTVAEVTDEGANVNADGDDTIVVACPITDFWTEIRNGRAGDQPSSDCDTAAVAGQRDDDGNWTFDLLPIGSAWLDSFGTIAPDGVLLTPGEEAGDAFQVVFDVSTIDVIFEFTEGAGDDDAFGLPEPTVPVTDSGPTGDFGAGSGQAGTFNPPPPPADTGSVDVEPVPEAEVDEPEVDEAPQEVAAAPVSSNPGFLEGLPGGAPLLFILFAGLLYAMTFALGSAGDPATEAVRQRGVSRALAARERAEQFHLDEGSI